MHSDMAYPIVTFLRLPSQIRKAIYIQAGAVCDASSPISIHLGNHEENCTLANGERMLTTLRLLLTCRTIYEELGKMVYAHNHFFVRVESSYGMEFGHELRALQRLNPVFINSMTLLTIHLSVYSCHLGVICEHFLEPVQRTDNYEQLPDVPSDPEDDYFNQHPQKSIDLLNRWTTTWTTHIRPNSNPGQLNFHLIYDVYSYDDAFTAMEPLLSESYPILASCSIRLSYEKNIDLQQLAERTVNTVTIPNAGVPGNQFASKDVGSFRYMDLPTELRMQILSHTPLITPYRDVQCDSYEIDSHYLRDDTFPRWKSQWLHGKPFRAVKNETGHPDAGCFVMSHPAGCFCKNWHSAYSSIYECQCWSTLTDLFLVSKAFRLDASQCFFSLNRFTVVQQPSSMSTVRLDHELEKLSNTWLFTNFIPRDGLQYLRNLEIIFPSFGEDEPCDPCPRDGSAWIDWNGALQNVQADLDLFETHDPSAI